MANQKQKKMMNISKDTYDNMKQWKERSKSQADEIKVKDAQLKEKDALVAELREKIKELQRNRGQKGKSGRKSEQKEDVVGAMEAYIKLVLFRTVKFAQVGEELKNACSLVWHGIKDQMRLETGPSPLDLEEFTNIYDSAVLKILSDRRQYIQSRAEAAAREWYDEYGDLPTQEQMEGMWDVDFEKQPENEQEKEDYEAHMIRLTWYLDRYMQNVAQLEYWGQDIRPFHLMTDKLPLPNDPQGPKKVLVTVTSEAFGLLLFENCRDKWIATWKYKAVHGKRATAPAYDKDDATTHIYQNKWSNSRTGQVQGGGWSLEGLQKLNDHLATIRKVRDDDKANGYAKMKAGQKLIRAANKIGNACNEPAKKKQKKGTEVPDENRNVVNLVFLDE